MSDGAHAEAERDESSVRGLIELIVRGLVDHPETVEVSEQVGERSIVVRVRVPGDEVGKVIGRGGRIANSLRLLAKAAAARVQKSVWVEIAKLEDADEAGAKEDETES